MTQPLFLMCALTVLLCCCGPGSSGHRRDPEWFAARHGTCQMPLPERGPRLLAALDVGRSQPAWRNATESAPQVQLVASMLDAHRVELLPCVNEGESLYLHAVGKSEGISVNSACGVVRPEAIACVERALYHHVPIENAFIMQVDRSSQTSRTKALIKEITDRTVHELRTCYEDARRSFAAVGTGKVVLEFMIDPAGEVVSSRAVENATGSAELACCLNSKARSWKFSTIDGCGLNLVVYPIVFAFKP